MAKSRPVIAIFSIAYFPLVGGAEVALREITKRLNDSFEFHLITLRTADTKQTEIIDGVTVHRIGVPANLHSLWGRFVFALHKYTFPILGYVALQRLMAKHTFSVVWGMMANYAGMAATLTKIFHPQMKFLLTLQEGDPISYIKRRALPVYPLFQATFRKADYIQTISHYLAQFARDMGFQGDLMVVPNGVDIHHFSTTNPQDYPQIRQKLGISEGETVIITASRLVQKNGVDTLIEALAQLSPQHHLVIAGNGNLEEKFRMLVEQLGVSERVHFLGFVSHLDLPGYFHISDMFVRPSRSEGLGNVFLEAMSAGLPVVATPVGGIVDIVEHENTGLLVQPDSPKELARAIERLGNDDILRERIIVKGREFVASYDWSNVSDAMNGIFQKML